MVNPFNGEGIAYAMESAAIAARCAVQSLARRGTAAEKALEGYPVQMRQALGGYYRIGNVFSRLIGNPTDHGPGHPARPAPPHADGVPAQAAGQPVRPAATAPRATG